jgi:hypothetical protein
MYRLVGVFFLTGLLGLTYITSNDETSATGRKAAQPAPLTDKEASGSVEHVLHLRTHKRQEVEPDRSRKGEASQPSRESGSAAAPTTGIDPTPTGSIEHGRKKTRLAARKSQKKKAREPETGAESASAEIEAPQPRGFFESLFNSN